VDAAHSLTVGVVGLVVYVTGELDASSAPMLVEALEPFAGQRLAVDLSAVTFMDSSGLRALIRVRTAGTHLAIVSATPSILRMLQLTGVVELFSDT
jgi:anti-sigma B factor antagonist